MGYQRHHFGHLRITGSVATKERTQKLVDEEKNPIWELWSIKETMEGYQGNYCGLLDATENRIENAHT